ncbi:hypothetical protein ASC94_14435 [Massilia sp. Root418]|uniref:hypothetical protein n=1 Tax=Massilia sp. Root418 TaxID=1736532 RepID=UPI0006F461A5|nr:hypothetical protein [Massilia sp. Root418]KQW93768.1 hypothetical protein ASC94_14435 [Massilia sp. Root418]
MKKLLKYLLMGCTALMFSVDASAADKGSADEAVAMVKKAGEFLKKHGKEKAFAEFNKPKGAFIQKDLYIFAFLASGDGVGTGSIDAKRTYVERVDDVILGSGVYK